VRGGLARAGRAVSLVAEQPCRWRFSPWPQAPSSGRLLTAAGAAQRLTKSTNHATCARPSNYSKHFLDERGGERNRARRCPAAVLHEPVRSAEVTSGKAPVAAARVGPRPAVTDLHGRPSPERPFASCADSPPGGSNAGQVDERQTVACGGGPRRTSAARSARCPTACGIWIPCAGRCGCPWSIHE
jgi:hypothetical protein